jgi:hypothetical protein
MMDVSDNKIKLKTADLREYELEVKGWHFLFHNPE